MSAGAVIAGLPWRPGRCCALPEAGRTSSRGARAAQALPPSCSRLPELLRAAGGPGALPGAPTGPLRRIWHREGAPRSPWLQSLSPAAQTRPPVRGAPSQQQWRGLDAGWNAQMGAGRPAAPTSPPFAWPCERVLRGGHRGTDSAGSPLHWIANQRRAGAKATKRNRGEGEGGRGAAGGTSGAPPRHWQATAADQCASRGVQGCALMPVP